MRFCAKAVFVGEVDEVFMVVLAEREDRSGTRVELQRSSQESCIMAEPGGTTYGGVSDWGLQDARLAIWLKRKAERELELESPIVIDLPAMDAERVKDGVQRVFILKPRPIR